MGELPSVPIPNTEVKPSKAGDTASASRTGATALLQRHVELPAQPSFGVDLCRDIMNGYAVRRLQILEETFPGGRAVPTGKHKKWYRLFIRVAPAA
jgi:hypothetical protein